MSHGPEFGSGFDLAVEEQRAVSRRPAAYPAPIAESEGGVTSRAALPGRGKGGDRCGEWVPEWICDTHKEARITRHRCERRDCPQCAGLCVGREECPVGLPAHPGGQWAHREASIATDRFEDFIDQNRLGRIPLRQVIFSVPRGHYSEGGDHRDVIGKIRSKAEQLAGRFAWRGYHGGSAVVHLWRGCDGRYDEWGPHVHLVCFGIDVRAWNRYRENYRRRRGADPEFILKQAEARGGGFAHYRGFGLRRHLVYELGHAAVLEGGHALSWFGAMKTWKQPAPPGARADPPLCSEGCPMSPWDWRWNVGPLSEDADGFQAHRWDRDSHLEVFVEFSIVDGPPLLALGVPWGDRPACAACLGSWRPELGEIRCPHLG